MRSISEPVGILIFIVYWMITLSAWGVISGFLKQHDDRGGNALAWLYFLAAVLLSILFCIICFIRPEQSGALFYPIYTLFNALFLADFVCKIPVAASALVRGSGAGLKTGKVISRMGFILSAGMGIVFLHGILVGAKTCETREVTLAFRDLPGAFDGFRIVQISDSHLGSTRMKRMLKKLATISEGFKPGMVVFTGDLVNNFARETGGYPPVFQLFTSSQGNYAVPGNHDYGDYTRWPDSSRKELNLAGIRSAYQESGFRLLGNESVKIKHGGDSIYLAGVENPGHPPLPRYADLAKAARELPDSAFCILLCHDPAYWDSTIVPDGRFPLTLSGHTHGFQFGIHVAGIQFNLMSPLEKRWGGLYGQDNRYLYVNRGTGMIGMHFRIDMPAEITLITLQRGEINR